MTSTLRQRRYTTRSSNASEISVAPDEQNDVDNNEEIQSPVEVVEEEIIDLTSDYDNVYDPDNTDECDQYNSPPDDFDVVKSETLTKHEHISFVLSVSCLPLLLIMSYNIFPIITLILAIPWIPILYIIKSYSNKTSHIKKDHFFSMSTIMWHRTKDYMMMTFHNI